MLWLIWYLDHWENKQQHNWQNCCQLFIFYTKYKRHFDNALIVMDLFRVLFGSIYVEGSISHGWFNLSIIDMLNLKD